MAEIFTSTEYFCADFRQSSSEPSKSTLNFLRQYARAYSPLLGGFILN